MKNKNFLRKIQEHRCDGYVNSSFTLSKRQRNEENKMQYYLGYSCGGWECEEDPDDELISFCPFCGTKLD